MLHAHKLSLIFIFGGGACLILLRCAFLVTRWWRRGRQQPLREVVLSDFQAPSLSGDPLARVREDRREDTDDDEPTERETAPAAAVSRAM